MPYATLAQWAQTNRIDSSCQVYQEGWPAWKSAAEQFPGLQPTLGAGSDDAGPFNFSTDSGTTSSTTRSSGSSLASRHRRQQQWKWGWNPFIGITYGPIPVGLVIAGIILVIALLAGALNQ
jgi:hypothetical protein